MVILGVDIVIVVRFRFYIDAIFVTRIILELGFPNMETKGG